MADGSTNRDISQTGTLDGLHNNDFEPDISHAFIYMTHLKQETALQESHRFHLFIRSKKIPRSFTIPHLQLWRISAIFSHFIQIFIT